MGFDIECIVNIQSYPGEYFCPVCRTLVYPNEAIQAQCTHLYCKPCLTYVANTTKACPYDQYLVTEADAKPLIESDKALAENIGKVKVHCMFQRSGCTWEGTLSESASHCSGCTFGNSSVICNRCGIQILHRQVHDHAQTCSGTYQAPQAIDASQNAASSSVTASTTYVEQNQTQISQTSAAPLPSGQAPTQTSDQWYQQQYYQQQYPGYNPYQQYYPYPQQGQYNSQAYVQPHPQPQAQPQLQSYPQTQPPVVVQGTNQVQAQVQSAASHYQQVNPQQQFSSSQPQPQQYAQVPGYQQPVQSTYPAIPSQNNTQPQSLPQAQIQPQYPLQHQSLPYSQQYPQQVNQPPVPNAVVTGHQSYQPPQQVSMAPLQQQAVPSSHVATGHILQQPPSARPPLSDGLVANQQKSAVSAHMPNNYPTQLQQLHPRAHTPASLVQHNAGIQSVQQSMPQQSQAFHAPFQGQYSQIRQQLPLQSQLRPQGPPHGMQTGAHGHNPSQKNAPFVPGFIPQQPQNYGAQQPMPAVGGFAPPAPNKPGPHGSNHSSVNNNFAKRESNSPGHLQKKDTEAGNTGTHIKMEKELVEESREGSGSNRIVVNDANKDVNTGEFSDAPSAGKPLRASAVGENIDTGVRKEFESFSNQKDSIMANRDSQSTNLSASNANGSDKLADHLKSQSLHSSGLHPQAPGFSPSSLTRQRPDHLPPHAPISGFPGPGSTASYGRGRGSFLPPDSVDPRSGGIGRTSVLGPEGPLGHGATGMGNDRCNLQDGTMGPPSRFMPPPPRPDIPERVPQFGVHDGFRGKAGVTHPADFLKPNTGYGRNHGMPPHDREYPGMPPHEPRAFGVRPRPFNLPPDSVGGLPSSMQRIEHGGTDHLRYGEHITPGHRHNHLRNDPLEEEFLSGLSRRGHMSGPPNFPGHFHSGDPDFPGRGRMGEMGGGFLHHLSGRESFTGNFPDFPRPGETGVRSNYSRQGFADDRFYTADLGSFDKSRKRKPVSMGWCRICKIDCESVEGLDMHSQTREHQRTALDIVKIIKQQNKKNIKMPGDRALTLEASKARNSDFDGRGSKP